MGGSAGSWAAVGSAALETAGSREVSGDPETQEGRISRTSEVHGRPSGCIRDGAGGRVGGQMIH